MTREMYQEQVLDHAKHPRYVGLLPQPTNTAHAANPLCGDSLDLTLRVDDGVIRDIGTQGQGCAISRAATSMLSEYVVGKRVDEVARLGIKDIEKVMGVAVNPARLKCATLGLETLQRALKGKG